MALNIGTIFDDIDKYIGLLQGAVDKGAPVATDLAAAVGTAIDQLVGIGKSLFAGNEPTADQIAQAEKLRHDLAKLIESA